MCGIETRKATPHRRKGFADLDVTWVASPSMPPTLRTERLLLEPYISEDEEGFVALSQDTRVSKWMGDGTASEAADRALFGRIFTKVYAQDLFDVWAVRRNGLLVGHAEIKPNDVVGGHEIIYALAPTAWGAGLGSELAEAIVRLWLRRPRTDQGVRHCGPSERGLTDPAGRNRFRACPGHTRG